MFDVFKKRKNNAEVTEANVQSSEVKYMSAQETLELASKQWKNLTTDKIFSETERAAKMGLRSVTIHDAYISEEQKIMIEELGYKVKCFGSEGCHPFIEIYW